MRPAATRVPPGRTRAGNGPPQRRLRALAGLLAAALCLTPAAAFAGPILSDEDATDLAQKLADANEEQDICYGWEIRVSDERSTSQSDVGSSSGPGVKVDRNACPRWMVLTGSVRFTSDSSEQEDSASLFVDTNLPTGITSADLRGLGVSERDLLGDRDDAALFNAVGGLPLLAAQRGLAPPIPVESNTEPLPSGDAPTGKPSGDLGRTYAPLMALAVLAMIAGAAGIVLTLVGVLPRTPRPPGAEGHPTVSPEKVP